MPKNINLKIDQTTYEIIILQNKIPYISREIIQETVERVTSGVGTILFYG